LRRSTALLVTVALFLAGVVVGVAATHAFWAWQMHRPGGLAGIGLRWLGGSLERRLDLSPAQQREVEAILVETRHELEQVRHDVLPRLFAVRDRAFDRIEEVLTDEQRRELQRFRARHQRRAERLVGDW
jgi:Spy/CpxP family protein refolding chaperone